MNRIMRLPPAVKLARDSIHSLQRHLCFEWFGLYRKNVCSHFQTFIFLDRVQNGHGSSMRVQQTQLGLLQNTWEVWSTLRPWRFSHSPRGRVHEGHRSDNEE
jgi:hypothetical protein